MGTDNAVGTGMSTAISALLAIASVGPAEAGQHGRAAERVGLSRDRVLDVRPEIESDPALVVLRQALPDAEFEAAMARGRQLDPEAVAVELAAEGEP